MTGPRKLEWRVHIPNLIAEILINPHLQIMRQPLLITRDLLSEVAKRAIEINDPRLNELMVRLTLYEQADPRSPDYDPNILKKLVT